MRYSGCINIGKVRSQNEDNVYVNGLYMGETRAQFFLHGNAQNPVSVFAVFDGMGGEQNGELAARMAAEELCGYQDALCSGHLADLDNIVNCFISKANSDIEQVIIKTSRNMGSTLALLIVCGNVIKTYNLGDSRIYAYSEGILTQLSRDHTVTAQLVEIGLLKEDDARLHWQRNKLTKHLGLPQNEFDITPHMTKLSVKNGDIILLCSDGLTEMCSDIEIKSVLDSRLDDNIAEALVARALTAGGRDNISVIAVQI